MLLIAFCSSLFTTSSEDRFGNVMLVFVELIKGCSLDVCVSSDVSGEVFAFEVVLFDSSFASQK